MAREMMRTYSFTLELVDAGELTVELTDAIYGSGIDDALLHGQGSIVKLEFDREADSLGDAIGSAVKSVERAGFKVARIVVERMPAEVGA